MEFLKVEQAAGWCQAAGSGRPKARVPASEGVRQAPPEHGQVDMDQAVHRHRSTEKRKCRNTETRKHGNL